jgi:hypothetical protein
MSLDQPLGANGAPLLLRLHRHRKVATANMIGACPIDRNLLSCMANYEPRTLLLIALGIILVFITIFMIRTSTR